MASEPIEPLDSPIPINADAPIRHVGFEARGTTTRLLWLALALLLISFVAIFLTAFLGGPGELAAACGSTFLGSALLSLLSVAFREVRFPIGRSMKFEQDALRVLLRTGKTLSFAPETFVEGWYSLETRRVHLRRRDGNIVSADVPDAETASQLLQQLGVDASKRTMRIRLGAVDFLNAMVWLLGPIAAIFIGEAIGSAVRMNGALSIPIAVIVFILEFFAVRKLFGPAHLVIGADGIIVEKRFGKQFVPYGELESISTADSHVTLHLVNGSKIRAKARHLAQEESDVIDQRVRDALALRDQRLADPAALAALDRGKHDGKAWRDALRGLFDKDRGYRQAKLTREQISAVLVDPAAPVDRRIGAAMALSQSGDVDLKSKIRVAVESSANQKVRVAFEAIGRGDLENAAIEEAAVAEIAQSGTKRVR